MATSARIWTAEEFLALPEDPQHRKAELIAGRTVMHDPKQLHQLVVRNVMLALHEWAVSGGYGHVIFSQSLHLTDRDVLSPDVLWWADPSRVDSSTGVQPVPDLVAEVRSPSTWAYDVGVKRRLYEEHGAGELWLVDVEIRAVLIARRSAPEAPAFDDELVLRPPEVLASPALPGFELAVEDLFRFP
ncbi:MAG: Uma2 family endonuclease [Solirubrobacteraceae bacterium]